MTVPRSDWYRDISSWVDETQFAMVEAGYDALAVYGNAETHGSIRYLSGYSPDRGTTMRTTARRW